MIAQGQGVRSLISKVEIEDIRLVELAAKTTLRSPWEVSGVELRITKSATATEPDPSGTFCVTAVIDTELLNADAADKPVVVSIRAGFELRYHLPEGMQPDVEDLNAFAEINGVYNVWPYWREVVQNTFARMSLPPVTLPLYKVSSLKKALDEVGGKPQEKPAAK